MKKSYKCLFRAGSLLLVGALTICVALGDEPPSASGRDRGKRVIEQSRTSLLAKTGPGSAPSAQTQSNNPAHPRVAPGKVRWHADFATACAAARTSGKPVLLFHLMGRLDDRFC